MLKKATAWTKKIIYPKTKKPVFFDDDVFLVSYPKSGSTWLRFMIGNYLSNNNCDFLNSHFIVPDIEYNPESIINCTRPRIIKSHRPAPQPYKKVIYLIRDARDVAVSYYYHSKKYGIIQNHIDFKEFILKFSSGNLDGYGSWDMHVTGWINSGATDFILIRYEDLKDNTLQTLTEIIVFCGFDIDDDKLLKSIKSSDLKTMQNLEKSQHNDIKLLSKSDPSVRFVRKGTVGDWKNHFDHYTLDTFLNSFGETLKELGYI